MSRMAKIVNCRCKLLLGKQKAERTIVNVVDSPAVEMDSHYSQKKDSELANFTIFACIRNANIVALENAPLHSHPSLVQFSDTLGKLGLGCVDADVCDNMRLHILWVVEST